jgi:hypothetical protein
MIKAPHQATPPPSRKESQEEKSGDLIASGCSASEEELTPQPIKSVDATILQINGRMITIRVPSAHFVELEGKSIEINGFKAVWIQSVPSSETEDEKIDITDALLFKIAGESIPDSFKVAAVCEVSWQ